MDNRTYILTDKKLVETYQATKNPDLFAEIYKRALPSIQAVARCYVDPEAIDEVVQDVIVRVLRHFHNYDSDVPLHLGLRRWTQNHIYNNLKEVYRQRIVAGCDASERGYDSTTHRRLMVPRASDEWATGEEHAIFNESRDILAEAMSALPEKYRRVLELVYLEEMTLQETADIIGGTTGRVEGFRLIGLKRLRKTIRRLNLATELGNDHPVGITVTTRRNDLLVMVMA